MGEIFAKYLEAGIFGSIIILLIVGLRLCLRKAPRRILCLLWLVAAVRLFLPFQLESRISLQPDLKEMAVIVEHEVESPVDVIVSEQDAVVTDAIVPNGTATIPQDHGTQQTPVDAIQQPVDTWEVLSYIWLLVAGAAVVYMVISYLILKMRVRKAVRTEAGILECDNIQGAFLLGYLRPKIYLPMDVSDTDRWFIIAHERAHIARGDNWWKLLGFLCASLHWYNPLVWLSYVLLCRDIELACDERVIRGLDTEARKGYSMALLNCGKRQSGASVCPVAFGEVSLKTRIKSILRYRKPGVWITVIAFVLIAATAICFLTSPVAEALQEETPEKEQEVLPAEQTIEATEPETTQPTTQETEPETTAHIHAYTVQTIAPTCTSGGYDLHACDCGEQFQDNAVSALGHRYRKVAISGIYSQYACENCADEYWKEEDSTNTSTGSVDSQLTAYAASFGFDMDFVGSKVSARRFDYTFISYVNDEMLLNTGRALIKDAYQYCLNNGLDVSQQMCCVVVSRPSYPVDLSDTSVGWTAPSSWQPYRIYVYILPRIRLDVSDVTQNIDQATNNERIESTEPSAEVAVPESTEPTETVPETTVQTETAQPEEDMTDIQEVEETTVPGKDEDGILE